MVVTLSLAVLAQQPAARVAGLEKNAQYMQLISREQALRHREDSIGGLLDQARRDLRANPDKRAAHGAAILRLENEIYDVRSQLGMVAGQINSIEQQYVINSFGTTPADSAAAKLSMQEFIMQSLPAQDLALWRSASADEKYVVSLIGRYMGNYSQLSRMCADYAATSSAAKADSIMARYNTVSNLSSALSDSVGIVWGRIYDNKTYLCNLLMDKANNTEYLAWAQKKAEQLRSKETVLRGSFTSDHVGLYPLEKRYVLECELAVAEYISDGKAADSLRKAMESLDTMPEPLALTFTPRVFIPYVNAYISQKVVYNAANPIPKMITYKTGVVYRILIGNFSKMQLAGIFRNVVPLCVWAEDGRFRYYAGDYETLDEAEQGMALLRKAMFRSPQIEVWRDGRYEGPVGAGSAAAATEGRYRVEISIAEPQLDDSVRDLINTLGEGREISRVVTKTGDGATLYLFTVDGMDKATATTLAEAVRVKQPAYVVKVNEMPVATEE